MTIINNSLQQLQQETNKSPYLKHVRYMKFINEKKYQISKQQKIIYIFAGRVCFVICSENGYDVFKFNY